MSNRATLLPLLAGLLVLASPAIAGTGCAKGHAAAGCRVICSSGASSAHGDGASFLFSSGDESGAYLGVTLQAIDDETAEEAGMDDSKGALIRSVFDDTPADAAGLQAGDIVLRFAGESIEDVGQLVELVKTQEAGDEVQVRVLRDGREKRFDVTLAEREKSFTFNWNDENDGHFGFDIDDLRFFGDAGSRARLGVEVRDLDEDLGEYFDADEGRGALILAVTENSAASAAGLKPGDVVVEIAGEAIDDVADLRAAIGKASGEGETELVYLRHGKRKSTDVEIEAGADIPRMMMRGMPHKMMKKHGMKQWHGNFGDKKGPHIEKFFDGGDVDEAKLEKMIEKLEKRLEGLEKRLEDR